MGAVRIYLDASVLVPLFVADALAARAEAFLQGITEGLIVSDFASSEVSSAVARRVRTGEITAGEARSAFTALDAWAAGAAERVETVAADVRLAEGFVRRLDLPLRAPDALNIAIALRAHATLASFDFRMAAAARALGLAVHDA
jgi:uncharacterized protein